MAGTVLLEARHGDLCKEEVCAIVNAGNEQLRHGGGVARAIADQVNPPPPTFRVHAIFHRHAFPSIYK
jgi:O-acetyl-ADP-ribose deacetylase (regulator of RNase III)